MYSIENKISSKIIFEKMQIWMSSKSRADKRTHVNKIYDSVVYCEWSKT